MKRILFMSLGSRGDMEPFLALAAEMQDLGYEVGCCLPAQFKSLAREVSDSFFPQDKAFLDLLSERDLRMIMGQVGSGLNRIKAIFRLTKLISPIQYQLILDQEKAVNLFKPDLIIFHVKCIYPIFWSLLGKGKIKMLSPMPCMIHAVDKEPHIGFGNPGPIWWNRFTYRLAIMAQVKKSILGYGKKFMQEKGFKHSASSISHFIREELEVEYAFDTKLFAPPLYWPERAQVTQFRERNKLQHFTPPDSLVNFLKKFPNALYIGFGSMVNAQPAIIGNDILQVCGEKNIPVIINKSWGGIEIPETLPDWAFEIDNVPFDYLFPKVAYIIHHGGSGTTHSAFRCGKPQAIIPHIGDQFFWNRQIELQGCGISGFPIKKWSKQQFSQLLEKLVHCSELR